MQKRVLAIVVSYYPDKDLFIRNISALLESVDKLIIWENTPEKAEDYRYATDSKIEYVSEGGNVGISKALNYAYNYALRYNYDYLLTMDQDSYFINLKQYLDTSLFFAGELPYIYGPLVTRNKDTIPDNKIIKLNKHQSIITSGMLIPTIVLNIIGGYCEDFMVDAIDVDFCIRAKNAGYSIYRNGNGVLLQHFGEPYTRSLLGKQYICPNYSASRLYGIFRNHLIIYRRYHKIETKKLLFMYFRHFIPRIVLWEKNKIKKLGSIFKGITDGFTYKI